MPKGTYPRTEKSKNAKGRHWKLSDETKRKIALLEKFAEKVEKVLKI